MSRPLKVMGVLAVVLLLAGIWVQISQKSNPLELIVSKHGEIVKDDFVYRIYTERDTYQEGDSVTLISELEYVGDRKFVTILHEATPFHYGISENSGKYAFYYMMNQPAIRTTLIKGQPFRESYTSPGALIVEEGVTLPTKQAEVPFPAGQYHVSGYAKFTVSEVDGKEEGDFKIGKDLTFEVGK
ncbi:hypothetical protein [Paenibacillus sp. L3-i20]|uniref:hypothetical protein n=1 Tax=Paenibacillus sp. L3-i20 TaxID=2905833 RepID=UPI001EDEAA5B|nr:hypothetical protein [Paenibacillus sp. L3-i20]GKU76358.1 hypothetical protein L3i20_v207550 [Paenibacillus sp. L3-i20]